MPASGTERESSLDGESRDVDDAARVGEVLDGKYELVRKIGEGGMGEVFEARHLQLGRRFAVKLLRPELVASSRMLRRFSREVLAVSRLENDHLVPALDCGYTPQGGPYYVMEFLRGQDMRKLLRAEGPLALPRAVRLVIDACRGLAVAHEHGLVHRDLKPENVFVVRRDDDEERARVLDFGLVQLGVTSSAGHSGNLVGTIRYMAPEQARGDRDVDQRADVYALGAMVYECLAGVPPHAGETVEAVLFQRMNEVPAPLSELRPGIPEGLSRCVSKALERAREDRYDNALALADALLPYAGPNVGALRASYALCAPDEFAAGEPTGDLDRTGPEPDRSGFLRRHGRVVAGASVLLAVLATHAVDRKVLVDPESRAAALPPSLVPIDQSPKPAPAARAVEAEPRGRLDGPTNPDAPTKLDTQAKPDAPAKPGTPKTVAAPALRTQQKRSAPAAKPPESGSDEDATPSALFDSTNPYLRSTETPP